MKNSHECPSVSLSPDRKELDIRFSSLFSFFFSNGPFAARSAAGVRVEKAPRGLQRSSVDSRAAAGKGKREKEKTIFGRFYYSADQRGENSRICILVYALFVGKEEETTGN